MSCWPQTGCWYFGGGLGQPGVQHDLSPTLRSATIDRHSGMNRPRSNHIVPVIVIMSLPPKRLSSMRSLLYTGYPFIRVGRGGCRVVVSSRSSTGRGRG